MPELPEVETVRRTLTPVVKNQVIAECEVFYPRLLPRNTVEVFCAQIINRKITDIKRRGKYLLFELDSPLRMIVHLRMTGQLVYQPEPNLPLAKHTSARFIFKNKGELRFVDQRKFGTFYLLPEAQYHQIHGLYTLGPEPLGEDFTVDTLADKVQSVRAVKTILLDQSKIAGLGNIYADEALFRAKIHPLKPGSRLTEAEIAALHHSIRAVLREAIAEHGTTIKDYRTGSGDTGNFQNKLLVYRRTGKPCPNCSTPVERIKVGGRSTHFCPHCQRWDQDCTD